MPCTMTAGAKLVTGPWLRSVKSVAAFCLLGAIAAAHAGTLATAASGAATAAAASATPPASVDGGGATAAGSTLVAPWDAHGGYVLFCLCAGRLGNQVDHLLGALSFAMRLNRTLVVPPFVEYHRTAPRVRFRRFSDVFSIEALEEAHRVVELHTFLEHPDLAPAHWPADSRAIHCRPFSPPKGASADADATPKCNIRRGSPATDFWDMTGIEFADEVHVPRSLSYSASGQQWDSLFPPDTVPVLVTGGPPSRYPMDARDHSLQRFLRWRVDAAPVVAAQGVLDNLAGQPFVGLHVRQGRDWAKVCGPAPGSAEALAVDGTGHSAVGKRSYMSSAQCNGLRRREPFVRDGDGDSDSDSGGDEVAVDASGGLTRAGGGASDGVVTYDMCLPAPGVVALHTAEAIRGSAGGEGADPAVFIASDSDASGYARQLSADVEAILGRPVNVVAQASTDPFTDLYLLGRAQLFVGNCVSSFTAFVARQRAHQTDNGTALATEYFGTVA